jgi:hypothetical protein
MHPARTSATKTLATRFILLYATKREYKPLDCSVLPRGTFLSVVLVLVLVPDPLEDLLSLSFLTSGLVQQDLQAW